jgi:hypothetical protein
MDLPGLHLNAAGFTQMNLGLFVDSIRPLQPDEPRQGGRIADFHPQSRIGRIMATLLAGIIIIQAAQRKGAGQALNLQDDDPLGDFAGAGPIGVLDPFRRALQERAHQSSGWLENGRPHQSLQVLHRRAGWCGRSKLIDQSLDFFALRQEE